MKKFIVIILFLGVAGFFFQDQLKGIAFDLFLKNKVENTLQESFEEVEPVSTPVAGGIITKNEDDPFTVLLLGIDARPGSTKGRSDAMIVATVRPEDHRISLVSIPRDAYVSIPGRKKDKITHAYAFGGAKLSIETVENFLDVPIDYYASINFQGFSDLIDQLGGVSLPITQDIVNKGASHEKFTIKANKSLYTGDEALKYARYREDSDVSRGNRHQIVIKSMLDRMKKIKNISKISSYFAILGKNFKTNVPSEFATDIAKSFIVTSPTLDSYTLSITDSTINGIYYAKISDAEVQKVHDMITQNLKP